MNIAKLRSYLEELSKDTFYGDLDKAEVVRGLIELDSYVPKDVNENVVLSGTTAATTRSYLNYGVNNVNTASATAYAIRLPYPPQKGKQVIIVNNSTMAVAVYPSVTGGSINGTLNGVGMVPNDGKAYTFYCYENPLPGAWSWTPPAINQYDSGEVTITTPGGNTVSTLVSPSFFSNTSSAVALGGLSSSPIFGSFTDQQSGNRVVFAKPATNWNSITKVKVYTNAFLGLDVGMYVGGGYSLKNTTTGVETPWASTQNNYYVSALAGSTSWQTVPGTPSAGAYSANIGDAGTKFIELSPTLFAPAPTFDMSAPVFPTTKYSTFGSVFLGTQTDDFYGVTYEKWWTQTFTLYIIPRGTANQTLKVRYFIEYN